MSDQLHPSNLRDVVAALQGITDIHQLGLALNTEPSKLREIEGDHRGNINRQRSEVIENWLRDSPDASWTTLANAVEGMGGHTRLVERLRSHPPALGTSEAEEVEQNREDSQRPSIFISTETVPSPHICVETCETYNILLLGKRGHGKSTLGNKLLNAEGYFRISFQGSPQVCNGSAVLRSASRRKDYRLNVYDCDGLFEDNSLIYTLSSQVPNNLKLVVFVLKYGHSFDTKERDTLEAVMNVPQVSSQISALFLTHCEGLTEEERERRVIRQFRENHPSVAKLMGKGILAVGFPDSSHIKPGSELSQRVENDKEKLKQLIYDGAVTIPESETSSFVDTPSEELPQIVDNENDEGDEQPDEGDEQPQVSQTDVQPLHQENSNDRSSDSWLKKLQDWCCLCFK